MQYYVAVTYMSHNLLCPLSPNTQLLPHFAVSQQNSVGNQKFPPMQIESQINSQYSIGSLLNGLVKALKWRLEHAAQVAISHAFVFVYNGEFICFGLSPWFQREQ
jgi:hypothetical protein